MINISERQARLWCLILGAGAGIAAGVSQLLVGAVLVAITGGVAGLLLGLLAFLYWRGWETARLVAVTLFTLAVIGAVTPSDLLTGVVIASTFALLLANPWWVLGVGSLTVVGMVLHGFIQTNDLSAFEVAEFPVIVMLVGIMAITRLVLEGERHKSREFAARADEARAQSERQAAELAEQAEVLSRQNAEQRELLELVSALETPAVAIAEHVLLTPLIGHVDSRRMANLTSRMLELVSTNRTRLVILDLSGVPTVDSAVAQNLLRMIKAIQLLGCDVGISGIAAPVAATMAHLGLDLVGVQTWRSPQAALEAFTHV